MVRASRGPGLWSGRRFRLRGSVARFVPMHGQTVRLAEAGVKGRAKSRGGSLHNN